MNKDIKDYLRLHLGCEAKSSKGTMVYRLSSVDLKGRAMFYDGYGNDMWLGEDFKLILRPLSDMSEEEEYGLEMLGHELIIKGVSSNEFHAERTKYLLSKHFDLFGLHETGLCLYKSDLK